MAVGEGLMGLGVADGEGVGVAVRVDEGTDWAATVLVGAGEATARMLAVGDAAGLTFISPSPTAGDSAAGRVVGEGVGMDVAALNGTGTASPDAAFGACGTGMKHAVNKNASPIGTSAWTDTRANRTLFKYVSVPYRL